MAPDDVTIGDWLQQDPSDPQAVAGRYDEWAQSYDQSAIGTGSGTTAPACHATPPVSYTHLTLPTIYSV